jgi:gluconokinase
MDLRALTVVVMGVAGCGKTTVGQAIAADLGCPFLEGDTLHSARNVALMTAGTPLTDYDRRDWLETISKRIETAQAKEQDLVVSCSALKRRYRDQLRKGDAELLFVHLEGSPALMEQRLNRRQGHFMPKTLIASQFEALEVPGPDERVVRTTADRPIAQIVAQVRERISHEAVC